MEINNVYVLIGSCPAPGLRRRRQACGITINRAHRVLGWNDLSRQPLVRSPGCEAEFLGQHLDSVGAPAGGAAPLIDLRVFAASLAEAVKSGRARAVGVSNFNANKMRRIADHLDKAGVPLAANQVNYSLLKRAPEINGVLDACRDATWRWWPICRWRPAG